MGYWSKPNVFKVQGFLEIPMGDHRVKITGVNVERFTKTKKRCYEISLKVSGYPGKIWHHIWWSPNVEDRSDLDFLAFFKAFQIEDHNLRSYKKWIGKEGGVYVWHEHGPSKRLKQDEYEMMVRCYLPIEKLEQLPPWSDEPTGDYLTI